MKRLTIAQAQAIAKQRNDLLLRRRHHWQTIARDREEAASLRVRHPGDARPFDQRLIGRAVSPRRLRRQIARKSPLEAFNESLRESGIRLHPTKGWRFGSCA